MESVNVPIVRLEALANSKEFRDVLEVLMAEERGRMENFIRNQKWHEAYGSQRVIEVLGGLQSSVNRIARMVRTPEPILVIPAADSARC